MRGLVGSQGSAGRQPGIPTIGTAVAEDSAALVNFTAPDYLGKPSSPFFYEAISDPEGITATSQSSPIEVIGLTNSTSYTFKIRLVIDGVSSSDYSASSNEVTPSGTAPPPTFVTPPNFITPPNFVVQPNFPNFPPPNFPNFPNFPPPQFIVPPNFPPPQPNFPPPQPNFPPPEFIVQPNFPNFPNFPPPFIPPNFPPPIIPPQFTPNFPPAFQPPPLPPQFTPNFPPAFQPPPLPPQFTPNFPPAFQAPPNFFRPPNFPFVPPNFFVPPSFGGCIYKDTMVLTTDGRKKVKDLNVGDELVTYSLNELGPEEEQQPGWNFRDWSAESLTFENKVSTTITALQRKTKTVFYFNNDKKDRFSNEQPMFVKDGDSYVMKYAQNVKAGDVIIKVRYGKKQEVLVESINKYTEQGEVYQVSCEPYDWFIAGRYLVHNK